MSDHASEIDPRRVRALFEMTSAVPLDRQRELLDEACAPQDAALRAEVLELLELDAREHSLLDTPLLEREPQPSVVPAPPEMVGAYRIVRRLGSGSMGTVYAGEHVETRQPVAVKMMRRGLLSDVGVRRFRQEGEILQRLHHPYIAQIFEAGTSTRDPDARPYLVMALVDGMPIDRYCVEAGLSTHEKLELLARLCEGVGHAHRHGVIHRDLKPGNVLVDKTGAPRILDFGIARAVGIDDPTQTSAPLEALTYTATGQLIGTLPYMSPEQASGAPSRELDVRSDVYALGVLAYRVLSGRHPYDLDDLSLADALRIIAQHDPPLLGSLNPAHRGAVETIVARALEKSPDERYASADELADDIRRALKRQPVSARLPSAWDVLRRFTLRNPALARALGLAIVALVLGIVGTSWGLISASEQRGRVEHLLEQERAARRSADHARSEAEEAVAFLTEILAMSPETIGRTLTVEDAVAEAAAKLDASPPDDALLAARLHLLVGRAFCVHEKWDRAEHHYDAGVALRAEHLGRSDDDTLSARAERLMVYQMHGDFERLSSELDAMHADGLGEATVFSTLGMLRLATAYRLAGQPDEALRIMDKLRERRDTLSRPMRDALDSHYGDLLFTLGRYAEAEPFARADLEDARTRFGMENPITFVHMSTVAQICEQLGRFDESTALAREATNGLATHAGLEDLRTVRSITNNIRAIARISQDADTIRLLEMGIGHLRELVGSQNIETGRALAALAALHMRSANIRGLDAITEALAIYRIVAPHEDLLPMTTRQALLASTDAPEVADEIYRRALAQTDDPLEVALILNCIGDSLAIHERFAEATEIIGFAFDLARTTAPDDMTTLMYGAGQAGMLLFDGRVDDAERVLDCVEQSPGAHDERIQFRILEKRATIAIHNERDFEAETAFRRARKLAETLYGPAHFATQNTSRQLALLLLGQQRVEEARQLALELLADARAALGDENPETSLDIALLAACLLLQGHTEQAEALRAEADRLARKLDASRVSALQFYDLPKMISEYWDAAVRASNTSDD